MNVKNVSKGVYSLQRRIQFLVAISIVVAMFVLLTGGWFLSYALKYDTENQSLAHASSLVLALANKTPVTFFDHGSIKEQLDLFIEKNPSAWYYYEDSKQVIRSFNGAPKFKGRLVGNQQSFVISDNNKICGLWPAQFQFESSVGASIVMSKQCEPESYYLEVAGISHGISINQRFWQHINDMYFDSNGRAKNVIPTVVVMFITIAFITLLFGNMMRRVTRISRSASLIGKGKHHVQLPEKNLPIEILPMVQAINRAIERLEASGEQQALFVAAAAHELRTPLTVFRTRLEQMEHSKLKNQLVEDIKRVDRMVTQLLTLARLGSSNSDFIELDLVDIAQITCRERGGAVFVAGKELEFEACGYPAKIIGNLESAKTAIVNLIDNALLFTPKGKSVCVSVEGNVVRVSDSGPGVPEKDRERIFEPFFKEPPNKAGHGLGLAIVAEIMRIHEGTVTTHNRVDGGAVFELTFREVS